MKVYFTASIVGKKYYLKNYLRIIDIFHKKKYHVDADHIIKSDENKIDLKTKGQRFQFQKQLHGWINACNFMVVEASFPSISVGYEIALALQIGKPVLVLYSQKYPPTLLGNEQNEKLVCEKYTSDTLISIIDDFINYIEGVNDTRFTFFITPKIANYLERISKKEKLPKSVYLRKLIEKEMAK